MRLERAIAGAGAALQTTAISPALLSPASQAHAAPRTCSTERNSKPRIRDRRTGGRYLCVSRLRNPPTQLALTNVTFDKAFNNGQQTVLGLRRGPAA